MARQVRQERSPAQYDERGELNRDESDENEPPSQVTELLNAWQEGRQGAVDELIPFVYQELRKLARSYLRNERPDHTLQATALVNEAYLRLMGQKNPIFRESGQKNR